MRKALFYISILLVITFMSVSCFANYDGWKTVKMDGIGSLKVPESWLFSQENGLIYFTDKPITENDYQIFLLQPNSYPEPNLVRIVNNKIEGEYKVNPISSAVLSNGAGYGQEEYEIDGIKLKKYYIEIFYSGGGYCILIAWDDLLDKRTIIKIAESFVSE